LSNTFTARTVRKTFRRLVPGLKLALALFGVGILVGLLVPSAFSSALQRILALGHTLDGFSYFRTVSFIWFRNVLTTFVQALLGTFFGLLPGIASFYNGGIVGSAFRSAGSESAPALILALAPHGLFELPAAFLAWALGFWCASALSHSRRSRILPRRLSRSVTMLLVFVVPLLLVAALLEARS